MEVERLLSQLLNDFIQSSSLNDLIVKFNVKVPADQYKRLTVCTATGACNCHASK